MENLKDEVTLVDVHATYQDLSQPSSDVVLSDQTAWKPEAVDIPVGEEHVPDLYNLLDSIKIDNEDIEAIKAEAKERLPGQEKGQLHDRIDELRLQIEEEELKSYLAEFEEGIRDDVVMLGSISLEEVQQEEYRLRDEHIQYLEQEAQRRRGLEEQLVQREEQAKSRVTQYVKGRRAYLDRREELLRQKERLLMERLHRGFLRAESRLISVLEKRKGEVKTFYGDLMHSEGQYAGSKGRRWKVDWDRTPQPVQIKLKCLRGIKDKCPAGRYVLVVSLYDRIGGHAMRWSKLRGQSWGCATMPLFHEGNFHNIEIKLDQSVFTVLPPKPSLRPGMVLVFELFLLRGSVVSTDQIVAWGCFPICDGQFDIVEGRYHCPFLRGPMDTDIDKHDKIEELIASDLDHWMCNMYFEIVRLPRYFSGQKEYEVELQFSSGLTGYPDRVKTGWEENRDSEDPEPGSSSNVSAEGGSEQGGMSQLSIVSGSPSSNTSMGNVQKNKAKTNLGQQGVEKNKTTTILSRVFQKDYNKVKLPDSEGESEEDSKGEMSEEMMERLEQEVIQKEREMKAVRGIDGMYYKRYAMDPADEYFKHMFTMVPRTQLLAPKKKERKLTRLEQLEQHSFSVQPAFSGKGRMVRQGRKKMSYVARQFCAELGLSQWRSREFWAMLLMFLIVFWIRLYMHYLGQWIFLSAINTPINQFTFQPYTVTLNYQATLLLAREEIAVVVLGPAMNVLVFSFLVLLAWILLKVMGVMPGAVSKFILAYGVMTFLDPLLICIVDCILGRYKDQSVEPVADIVKLYWHFTKAQGEGLAGIFLAIFLYTFTSFFATSILYMYFLRLHNNGRLLDVYWRLHGDEDQFFTPYDLELSNQELSYICRKSEQWRGEEGARRKVAVYDYVWEEAEIDAEDIWKEDISDNRSDKRHKKEITTHVSIHTIHLDGLRELYRHFLRLPDGAIVEVFGDLSIPGMDKNVKVALEKGSHGIESVLGSQTRVRGRQKVHTASDFREKTWKDSDISRTHSAHSSCEERKKHI